MPGGARGTLFSDLASIAREVASTASRREKALILARFLKDLSPDEATHAAMLLTGRVFHPWEPARLNVSWPTVWRVVSSLVSADEREVREVASAGVDLGEAVRLVLSALPRKRQETLAEFGQGPGGVGGEGAAGRLTLEGAYSALRSLAGISGPGSRARREAVLRALFSAADPDEAWLLANVLVGETRLGLSEGILLDAVAAALGTPRWKVERAAAVAGGPAEVLREGLAGGDVSSLLSPRTFIPVRPMLAQPADDVGEALDQLGGEASLEYKLDGVRVQIHFRGGRVAVYSRRMSDITSSVPEVVRGTLEGLRVDEAILDGEVVAEGRDGRPLPFQLLMRRFRRLDLPEEVVRRIPLRAYLFDVLLVDGRPTLDEPYEARRRILEEVISPPLDPVPSIATSDPDEAGEFMEEAVSAGHEGVVVKRPSSPYVPGARGGNWLKVKRVRTVDLVIVAAERGYGRRHRWYSDYHLAARDPETGELVEVGKTFKGLTDEEFEWMTGKLRSIAVEERGGFIRVRPEVVVEVAFSDVQRSPKYPSGVALRFARIVRIRTDKSPEEADTVDRLRELLPREGEREEEQEEGGGG